MVTTVSVPRNEKISVRILICIVHYTDRTGGVRRVPDSASRPRGEDMAEVPDITAAVARTLQSLRAERGWSLDQLAARSGVSKGVLVALEQARSNPNLATLARISDAFGVPVTYLLDVPAEPTVRVTGPAQARTLRHGPRGGTGTIIAA